MGQIGSGLGDIASNSWGDLSGGEQAGKLGLGALQGGLGALGKQQQKPQGQGPMPVPMPQQPVIQLPGVNPSDPNKLRNPFFGQ